MKINFIVVSCIAVTLSPIVLGGNNEIKRGAYPFMAFLYYPDETVIDMEGSRFLRSAVLIRLDWLVTSAIGPSYLNNESEDFPKKTLLARLGAIAIDSKFTLNEDEDEQEREIIQIVRPVNHSSTQWWQTDITLMKTLYPFNATSAVYAISLNMNAEYVDKTCSVLIYARKTANKSEEVVLMQLLVDLLPPSLENCGSHYVANTMICAADNDQSKNAIYDSGYCRRNSGGPLICEGNVIGIQTYINNNCQQPHLYQLLSAWDNFINCGLEEKCLKGQCSNICITYNKDVSVLEDIFTTNLSNYQHKVNLEDTITISTTKLANTTLSAAEITDDDLQTVPARTVKDESASPETVKTDTLYALDTSTAPMSWPRKIKERVKLQEGIENETRKPNVEAQQKDIEVKVRSGSERHINFFQIVIFLSILYSSLS